MKKSEIIKLIDSEVNDNDTLRGKQGNQGNRGLQGMSMPFLEVVKSNLPIILLLVSMIAGWVTLSTNVQRIDAQQLINTNGIAENKNTDMQILLTLERIETNQQNMEKTLQEIKSDIKTHLADQ